MEIDLNELRGRSTADLTDLAERLHIEKASSLTRPELIFGILNTPLGRTSASRGSGILEILPDGFGFLRTPESSFLAGPDDIYVSPSQIRKFNLRTGDVVKGQVRPPKENERYFALIKVEHVNGKDPESSPRPLIFDHLQPVYPTLPLRLEFDPDDLVTRAIDLCAPLGKGQRVLVHAPPRSESRDVLRSIGLAVHQNHPECHLIVLLLHQRPEDVTEMNKALKGEVIATTFDEPAARHIQVADIVMERARRYAEYGQDVVVLLDSLTMLARASNEASTSTVVRALPGGLDPASLARPRRFMASARALAEGGSVSLVATLVTGSDSRLDESVNDLFRGTASAEIALAGPPAAQLPTLDPTRSATPMASRFLDALLVERLENFRIALGSDSESATLRLHEALGGTATNAEVLDRFTGTGQ
jgi:transcription termination factor Rho